MDIAANRHSPALRARLRRAGVALIATGFLLGGCATRVASTGAFAPPTTPAPRPAEVLVADFAAQPNIVRLDQSPGAILQRRAEGLSAEQAVARDVADVRHAITRTLLARIRAMGLPARQVAPGTTPGPHQLLVSGQITTINEGRRARRLVVGLGAGRSFVKGSAVLFRGVAGGPPAPLETYSLSANSGRMPGMGVGAASGASKAAMAVSAAAHAAGEAERTPVGREAASIAKRLSVQLGRYFAAEKWIPASAVPSALP